MLSRSDDVPDVAILMGTYEGPAYFGEQIESIIAQTHTSWKLWVSDDSASDAMLRVLETYRSRLGNRLQVCTGPRCGFVANFLALVSNPEIVGRHYAFSDQDDVWDVDKLTRAIAWLDIQPSDVPALYCSRVRLVDEAGREMGLSPLFHRSPAFRNALVQSIAGGNTMVFNEAARRLLVKAGPVDVPVHDWWLYLVATGCGGTVRYDERPTLSYRQHAGNQIGGNFTWRAMLGRCARALSGCHRGWHDRNLAALRCLDACLTPDSRACIELFSNSRRRWLLPRIMGLWRSGAHCQTWLGSAKFAVLALMGLL